MSTQLLHIFRNTPFGRETLLQSIYFCSQLNVSLVIYAPEFTKFLMYFGGDVVQIDLDYSYLSSPQSARDNVLELIQESGVAYRFLNPKQFTAGSLPDIPTNFDFMACPRSISDLSSKIGLGYIGPRVRRIVRSARFPILMTSPVFKPWEAVAVFFGGSANAVNALKLGLRISRMANKPLHIYTYLENKKRDDYKQIIEDEHLDINLDTEVTNWHFFGRGTLEDNLYKVPHNALIVLGAFGHGLIRNIVFGSKMEKIQSVMPNNLLIVGPNYGATI